MNDVSTVERFEKPPNIDKLGIKMTANFFFGSNLVNFKIKVYKEEK